MLQVEMSVNGKHTAAKLMIVRGDRHPRLRNSYYYHYQADDDQNHRYLGKVLHNYDNGAFALTQKVTKAIVQQQKSARANALMEALKK